MLHYLQDLYFALEVDYPVFAAERGALIGLYCKFLALAVAGHPDDRIRPSSQDGAQSVLPQRVRKVQLGDALFGAKTVRVVEGVDASLSGEEGVRHQYSGESFSFLFDPVFCLIAAALVAELYLLEGEQVEVGLLEKLELFVGVAHDAGLLALQGFSGEVRIGIGVGVCADLSDVGQADRLAQL